MAQDEGTNAMESLQSQGAAKGEEDVRNGSLRGRHQHEPDHTGSLGPMMGVQTLHLV